MKVTAKRIISIVSGIGHAVKSSPLAKKIASSVLAFTVVLSPVAPSLAVVADELNDETIVEVTTPSETDQVIDVDLPSETVTVDFSETESSDVSVPESSSVETFDPSESIDTTAPPTEATETVAETTESSETEPVASGTTEAVEETTVTEATETSATDVTEETEIVESSEVEVKCNIVTATSPEEYFNLVSELPDGIQRVIVDTTAEISGIEVANGVYYDGTYILVFDTQESFVAAVTYISDAGYEYAIDGTLGVCGSRAPAEFGQLNPNAAVKVAVIDTGSNNANEKYSVIGEDVSDDNGHGTDMCNYILSGTDNAYIISIKALDSKGTGNMSDVYAAVQMAEEMGVDYILLAMSIPNTGKYDAFISLIEGCNAKVVASAGNNSKDAAKYLPAGIPGVITVGAINNDGTKLDISNYGDSVDYYLIANSTSEAAAVCMSFLVNGQASILPTYYLTADQARREGDGTIVFRSENGSVLDDPDAFTINKPWTDYGVHIYEPAAYQIMDYFNNASSHVAGFYSADVDSETWGINVVYCIQDELEAPDGFDYTRYNEWSGSTNTEWLQILEAACAFGPSGDLYAEGLAWWKAHDTNNVLKLKNGTDLQQRRTMYLITHYVCCYAWNEPMSFSGVSSPRALDEEMDDYIDFILSARRSNKIGNKVLSDWWAEVYQCTEFDDSANGGRGEWSDAYQAYLRNDTFQLVARGGVTVTYSMDFTVTVGKSSSVTLGSGYPSPVGAQYTLYNSASASSTTDISVFGAVHTFTIGSNGQATDNYTRTVSGSSASTSATYYLKETKNAPGYDIDPNIYVITLYADGSIVAYKATARLLGNRYYVTGDRNSPVSISGSTVKVLNMQDSPEAEFLLNKVVGVNYTLLAGKSYNFELWDNTDSKKVADGVATVPANATNGTSVRVIWSNIASGYSAATNNNDALFIIAGHTYQIMETTTSVSGTDTETPSGWTKGTAHGKTCFYQTFTTSGGQIYQYSITNDVRDFPLTITKVSSNPGLTNGNSSYSLAGTTYVISTSANFATTAGTFVMNASGTTSTTVNVKANTTYYIKETVKGTGYKLDTTVYKVVISANGTATISTYSGSGVGTVTQGNPIKVNLKDPPETTDISLTKSSSNTTVTSGNSCYNLQGTTYKLYATQANANADTNALATFTVGADGKTTTTYTSEYNKTYYLKETSTGKGYVKDNKVYTVTVDANGVVTASSGATRLNVTKTGDTYYLGLTDVPLADEFRVRINKTLPDGTVFPGDTNAYNGAKFRLCYYESEVSNYSTLTTDNANVVFEFTVNSANFVVNRNYLAGLTPIKGTNVFTSLSDTQMPLGTYKLEEIDAPDGFARATDYWVVTIYADPNTADTVVRTRTKVTASGTNTAVSSITVGNTADETYISIHEPVVLGRYNLTKALANTNVVTNNDIDRYTFALYGNTGVNGADELYATGTVDKSTGKVLWTYAGKGLTLKGNDNSTLLSARVLDATVAGKAYNIILPVWKDNSTKITYTVHEYRPDTVYGNTSIKYTAETPSGWTKVSDNEFKKSFTLNSDASTTSNQYPVADANTVLTSGGTVTNKEIYTGLNVNKVVPNTNPFDTTKVTFKLYNTDNGVDTLIANGTVDSRGNVTWTRVATTGFGVAPRTSVNVINYLPLGHYRVEESWDKTYLNLSNSVKILIEETNNSGWALVETASTYTYTQNVDLSSTTNDGKVTALSVENATHTQKFNLAKTVTVAGDASTITAELYYTNGGQNVRVATGTCTTNGVGTYGFTWTYTGEHVTENGLDTLVLPVGSYQVVEKCPVTYYKNTNIPYTYMTPSGFTRRTVNGNIEFYRNFTLSNGDFVTLNSTVTNTRVQGSIDIVKKEFSSTTTNKTFTFEIYYRGNGATATGLGEYTAATKLDTVTITTTNGKGTITLNNVPEGWYEIRETTSGWTSQWANSASVVNGNKVIRLTSNNYTNATPTVNDNIKENGTAVSSVVMYNYSSPSVTTTLVDRSTQDHIAADAKTATLDDTVTYNLLMPGHYVVTGVLMNKATGETFKNASGAEVRAQKEFDVPSVLDEYGMPVPQSGTVVVTYTLDTSVLEDVTLVAYEEVHQSTETGTIVASHKVLNDANQTVVIPKLRTTLADSVTNSHVAANSTVRLVDTVTYTNLLPGKEYTVSGVLVNADTGEHMKMNGSDITASETFTASSANGVVSLTFYVDTALLEGATVVAFEDLLYKNIKVATHADINDEDQTVYFPKIGTTLIDTQTNEHLSAQSPTITLKDHVEYHNLKVGETYTMKGSLVDGSNGQPIKGTDGQAIVVTQDFKPTATDGYVDIEFTVNTSALGGKSLVAFEQVIYKGEVVASHEDLNDEGQTVHVPQIGTQFYDKDLTVDKDTAGRFNSITLIDIVSYENLIPNKTYVLTASVVVKETGEYLKNAAGEKYVVTQTFTPDTANGTVDVTFANVNAMQYKGKTLVCYETLSYNNLSLVVHANINDAAQTVHIPDIATTLVSVDTVDHIVPATGTVTLTDTVKYTNLIPGKQYVVSGRLVFSDGSTVPGAGASGYTVFKPTSANGTVDVTFSIDASVLQNKTIIAFEDLLLEGVTIATHADLSDKDQTAYIPEIGTTLVDSETGIHVAPQRSTITLVDTVGYKNLIPNKAYTMTGTLVNKADGQPIKDKSGNIITASVNFTPTAANGTVDVTFTFDSTLIKGETVVAFETLKYKGVEIAVHADIDDENQTVQIPDMGTEFSDVNIIENLDTARSATDVDLVDTVTYENLVPGKEYTVVGTVMVKETNEPLKDKDGNVITASAKFTPTTADGTVKITFAHVDTTLCEGKTLVAFETLSYQNVILVVHADLEDADQTVHVPKIRTTLISVDTEDHIIPVGEDIVLEDTVKYENLIPGKEYVVSGKLVFVDDGSDVPNGTGETTFTPDTANGTVVVKFTINSSVLQNKTIVAFEDLSITKKVIATHADLTDKDQTAYIPEIHTLMLDSETDEHVTSQKSSVTLIDTVFYANLIPGKTYTMTGTLMNKATNEPLKHADGSVVTATKEFTPDAATGTVEIEFTFDSSLLDGQSFVAFESLKYKGIEIATHNDITDLEQTVDVPTIHTTLYDKAVGEDEHIGTAATEVTLVDKVYYENLTPDLEYTFHGVLMVKETNEPFVNAEGEPYVMTKTFTPDTSKGFVEVEFTVDSTLVEGKTIVAFETLDYKSVTLVIHADIEDENQTVYIPHVETTALDSETRTHTITYKDRVTIVDTVRYENLIPGRTYTVSGTLYNVETGEVYVDIEGKKYEASTTFTPTEADGSVEVIFKDVLVSYTQISVVAFETLKDDKTNVVIATHADITDEEQTVYRATAVTSATINGSRTVWLGAAEVTDLTIVDTIEYTGLEVGNPYRIETSLYKANGTQVMKDGKPVTATVNFVPETKDGTVDVEITFSTEGFVEGDKVVVFEKIYDVATKDEIEAKTQLEDILVSQHADLSDENQTILIHFRPMTGGIDTPYAKFGLIILAIAACSTAIYVAARKKRKSSEEA